MTISKRFMATMALAAICVVKAPTLSWSADMTSAPSSRGHGGLFSEVRVGGAWHEPSEVESSFAITGEVLSQPLFGTPTTGSFVGSLLSPRLHVGGSANTSSKTSFAYTGFTWTFDIVPSIFIEGSLGVAAHNGEHSLKAGHNALGCSWGFHEALGLGFNLDTNWRILARVDHVSNAGICNQNRGLTTVGAQIGYRF